MDNELRKVIFNLNSQNLSLGDLNFNDSKGITKERRGYFHRWGDVVQYDSQSEKSFSKTVAIIEEDATGKIFEVAPHCIKFEKWETKIEY